MPAPTGISLVESTDLWKDFAQVTNRPLQVGAKPVFFYRHAGVDGDPSQYVRRLQDLDLELQKNSELAYLRLVAKLPLKVDSQKVAAVKENWLLCKQAFEAPTPTAEQLASIELQFPCADENLATAIRVGIALSVRELLESRDNASESVGINFLYKLVAWCGRYIPELFDVHSSDNDLMAPRKVLYFGTIQSSEVRFLRLLSQLGCDILCASPAPTDAFGKLAPSGTWYRELSCPAAEPIDIEFHDYVPPVAVEAPPKTSTPQKTRGDTGLVEKSYEELAEQCNSVVVVNVYNHRGELIGKGSGVVIGEEGLIVSNSHVVMDGYSYGISFERSKHEIAVDHPIFQDVKNDLAFLHVNQRAEPVVVKASDTLRRGQEIVTIGSPLGLVNTISNGIVSGFRAIDGIQFVQITAPISSGSSGGALLDKFGLLVGVTTAGFDRGQNINLAVSSTQVAKILARDWFEMSRALASLGEGLKVGGIGFMPRLVLDDAHKVAVLFCPARGSLSDYFDCTSSRAARENVLQLLQKDVAQVLAKYKVTDFRAAFMPWLHPGA